MQHLAKVATCSLNQWALDFEGNRERIVASIKEAKQQGARLRVGPELEITGYSCQDHFHEPDTVLHSWQVLAEVLAHPDSMDILLVIGMPAMHRSVLYNCAVVALSRQIILIRPKLMMCNDGNYRDSRYFTKWKKRKVEDFILPPHVQKALGQKVVPIGDAVVELNDTVIGIEICEEMWNINSPHVDMTSYGAEVIVNPSASYHELRKSQDAVDHIRHCTFKCGGAYIYSNLIGCDGDRLYFRSDSCISSNGQMVAQSPSFVIDEVNVVTASLNMEDIRTYRNHRFRSSADERAASESYPKVPVDFCLSEPSVELQTAPITWKSFSLPEEIMYGPACYLWDFLRRSRQSGFFLPLSGGRDSASVACIVYSMCQLVYQAVVDGNEQALADLQRMVGDSEFQPESPTQICSYLLHTCYLGTENSSSDTKEAASSLASEIGSTHSSLIIDTAVSAILGIFSTALGVVPRYRVRGGSSRENLALQNVQARLRMVISYCFAQLTLWARGRPGALLVLGTSNEDESLFGYMTKYDCSSADINPIGSISKQYLDSFLRLSREKFQLKSLDRILDAIPTAELEPLEDGKHVQSDEADMGLTYSELSQIGQLRKPGCHGPYSMFCKLLPLWQQTGHSPDQVSEKVKRFFRAYARNRHKMTVATPAYHAVGYSPDDHRHDHRPFLYNTDWNYQFARIDQAVDQINI